MDVSENSGTPKSSILIGFSIINHSFWGTIIFGNTHIFSFSFLFFSSVRLFPCREACQYKKPAFSQPKNGESEEIGRNLTKSDHRKQRRESCGANLTAFVLGPLKAESGIVHVAS